MQKRKQTFKIKPVAAWVAAAVMAAPFCAHALVIEEDFTKDKTKNDWLMPLPSDGVRNAWYGDRNATNTACLTAGSGTVSPTATVAGSPARCANTNDQVGQGALRLTPADFQRVGGIVSNFTFPTDEGVEISFTTYTWGGSGADGMTFFLADGEKPPTLGASGGSIGYQCSNDNASFGGVDGGYLGIGIDEWGNFAFQGDNTDTGAPGWTNRVPNTIGVRAGGSMNYNYITNPDRLLQETYTKMGWGTVPQSAKNAWVQDWTNRTNWNNYWAPSYRKFVTACKEGRIKIDGAYKPAGAPDIELSTKATDPRLKIYNYKYLGHKTLSEPLYNSNAKSRKEATAMLYRIRITPAGVASVWVSRAGGAYQTVISDINIKEENGYLPKSFRFGFMGATGGAHNNHEVICFKAAPATRSEGDLSTTVPNGRVVVDSQLFFSKYNSTSWTGQLLAQPIVETTNAKGQPTYGIGTANWDASCVLSGNDLNVDGSDSGKCTDTGKPATKQTSRNFLSWNGSSGIPLNWGSLTAAQRDSLRLPTESDDTLAQQRLEYLKGDQSQEPSDANPQGTFRKRKRMLGDIINSSPEWVGSPTQSYPAKWTDKRNSAAALPENDPGAEAYSNFKQANITREHIVYVGSNDGFMHGFRAGSFDKNRKFDATNNDGQEMLAFMPSSVLSRVVNKTESALNLTDQSYAHNLYNDADISSGDVFYGGKWHTWVMAGLGAGGSTVYALDVTDPSNLGSTGTVIGEWSYKASDPVWSHLGNTYGKPVFGRFHNGQWGAVFGNGWCSDKDAANGNCTASAGPAGIYVMSIDANSGAPSFQFISTGESGSATSPNGIAYVTPFDLDNDNIYDYAYAGDLKGNVWRFDLTADNSGTWAGTAPQKIFTTDANQPISTRVVVSRNLRGDTGQDPMLTFGTGKKELGYLGGEDTYVDAPQAVYGIRDTTAKDFPQGGSNSAQVSKSDLLAREFKDGNVVDNTQTRTISDDPISWDKHSGWYMPLGSKPLPDGSTAYEQVIYSPFVTRNKYLVLNTFINGSAALVSCDTQNSSGFTYPLNVADGTAVKGFWKDIDDKEQGLAREFGYTGFSPILTMQNGDTVLLGKKASGGEIKNVNLPDQVSIRRLSWRELF